MFRSLVLDKVVKELRLEIGEHKPTNMGFLAHIYTH
jgi:hypothetical protein